MMKTLMKILTVAVFVILSGRALTITEALTTNSAPYTTYTLGPNGRRVPTQTAYEPAGYMDTALPLSAPEDLYLFEDHLYIADTGNKRIIKLALDGQAEVLITNLNQPTGVHVDEFGRIYVADKAAASVYQYDATGTLLKTFTRPSEPIFGTASPFVPIKVATGPRGILYIVGEGSTAGVMQINQAGEFLGFFATNVTRFSWLQVLSNFFGITRASNIPTSASNVALDDKGSVYTVSNLSASQIKKFNIASTTVLSMSTGSQPRSVHINEFGNIFTISDTGTIHEFDRNGNLIFEFGGLDLGNRIAGLFGNPVDIVSDRLNNLFVLDKGTGSIQYFQRSEFAALVHQGLINFNNGVYSLEQWQVVLRMNSMFALANAALARGQYRLQNYVSALEYYFIAFDKAGYSEAFWQLRYRWLEQNLSIVFTGLIVVLVLSSVYKRYGRYSALGQVLETGVGKVTSSRIVKELAYMKHILVHPFDTYQDIKHAHKSSIKSALLILLIFWIVGVLEVYGTGFIFSSIILADFNLLLYSVSHLGIVGLFIFANYLVATISNGEGWLKDIVIATAYALTPWILITPMMTILSNVLTYNEMIMYTFLDQIRLGWTLVNLVFMIKEIHNFQVKPLLKNIALTIFTMVMIVLIGFLLYLLGLQVVNYIEGIIREVMLRG